MKDSKEEIIALIKERFLTWTENGGKIIANLNFRR